MQKKPKIIRRLKAIYLIIEIEDSLGMLQHWETDDIRLIDVRVVGYAKERTIHIGPDSIDSLSTIRAQQMRMEVMTKTKYLTQALP